MKTRLANIEWVGDLTDGGGQITTESEALSEKPFGFGSRFLDEPGTNPEELLAAAHASCFATHLALLLAQNGTPLEELAISSSVQLDRIGESRVEISGTSMNLDCRVAHLTDDMFQEIVTEAAADCPMSRALRISLDVTARLS